MDMFSGDIKNLENGKLDLEEVKRIIEAEYIIIKRLEELKNNHNNS